METNNSYPEFPAQCYVGVLGEASKILSEYLESPREFFFLRMAQEIGLVLAGRLEADFGDISVGSRLNIMKIGPVGTSKKSTADTRSRKFVQDALDIATAKQTTAVSSPADFNWLKVIPGAGSAEGVERSLEAHQRVLVSYDEFEKFRAKAAIEGSTLTHLFTELFESTTYANVTKSRDVILHNVHLALSVNCPSEEFDELPGKMSDAGLLSRFLFVMADRRHRVIEMRDSTEAMQPCVDRLGEYFAALDVQATKARRLKMTSAAWNLWNSFDEVIGQNEFTTRLDTIGQRLLTIFAFSSGKSVIDEEIVTAVFSLLKYQTKIRRLCEPNYAKTPAAEMQQKILRFLKRRQLSTNPVVTWKELQNGTRLDRQFTVGATKETLKDLIIAGAVKDLNGKYVLGDENV